MGHVSSSMLLGLLFVKNVCILIVQALMRRGLANLEMDKPEEAIKGAFHGIFIFRVECTSRCRQYMHNVINLTLALALRLWLR